MSKQKADFARNSQYLGYSLLLKNYTENVIDATEAQIDAAAHSLKTQGPAFVFILPHHGCLWVVFHCLVWAWFLSGYQTKSPHYSVVFMDGISCLALTMGSSGTGLGHC